jgi:hypothetical protein
VICLQRVVLQKLPFAVSLSNRKFRADTMPEQAALFPGVIVIGRRR